MLNVLNKFERHLLTVNKIIKKIYNQLFLIVNYVFECEVMFVINNFINILVFCRFTANFVVNNEYLLETGNISDLQKIFSNITFKTERAFEMAKY